jgi:N-acetylmuramoyl-L-alanine amidase
MGEPVDSDNMILGDGVPEGDTDVIWEGSVEYTGEAHSGTDIYYVGKKGSPNRSRIIVIDPGHQLKGSAALEPNGPNSEVMKAEVTWGATGVYTGQTEYELNLAVALLLRDELIRRGYSVVMIRETNNVSISNMKRAEIANKYEAAAYIRIHANSWTDSTMRGAMTICQSASNPYPTCAAHYLRSHRLSQLVLNEFCDQTGISKLNMREMDDMTGTNWSEVPTTILEMGFLSNKSDDTLMATDYFRQEAAIGVANGLDAYFEWLETQLPEWQTQPATEAPTRAPAEESAEEPTEAPTDTIGDVTTDTPTDTADVTEGPTVEATDPTETTDTALEDDGPGETTESEEPEEPEETEADVPADTAEDAPAEPPAEAA